MSEVPNIEGLATVMAAMLEAIDPLSEAVTGYKTTLIGRGFSEASAEAMAVQLHQHLMDRMFSALKS